ncbi:MAG: tellurite resistance TerB family protein [bacterium]|jgi:uncharacterized membrane protein YebE (DUF533 family)
MDIQKLLGGLLHGGLRIEKKQKKSKLLKSGFRVGSRALTHGSKSLFKGSKSSLGLGALALAFAAYEHLQERSSSQGQPFAASAPTPVPQGSGTTSPPPPPSAPAAPNPPVEIRSHQVEQLGMTQDELLHQEQMLLEHAPLLIQAMIAAANADGRIDDAERSRILDRFHNLELSDEEEQFLINELLHPSDMETLVRKVNSPELARQVYACSLMAIEVDTEEEFNYMEKLAERLNLDRQTVARIQEELEVEAIR